jgi:hypothetical protein
MMTCMRMGTVAACAMLGIVAGCATPCLDDGLRQKPCPEEAASATEGGTDSASASRTQTDSDSLSASATESTGSGGHDGATATATESDSDSDSDSDTDADTGGWGDYDDFDAGTLIIPMDTDYQDMGMLKAYGLVYQLLLAGVPVRWLIEPGKNLGDPDFTTSATDLLTGDVIADHGYRGGPFVVLETDAAIALPVVEAWQGMYPDVAVHEATEGFTGFVSRRLASAPTIAVFADGNENIARSYLVAAGIPDSTGDLDWPLSSPDMLTVAEISGPTDTDHRDGALFDDAGNPVYCELMSMHWDVKDAEDNPEVVAEVRAFLEHTTHFYAQCQAVNAFENLEPHGHFLTPNGLEIANRPSEYTFFRVDSPFAQIDGAFESVGGSEPAYSLPEGDAYKQAGTTIITREGTPAGVEDVWMTGFLDGACEPDDLWCPGAGKVSYLGGHAYSVNVPISSNSQTQGARLFLNSLFEAPCALHN